MWLVPVLRREGHVLKRLVRSVEAQPHLYRAGIENHQSLCRYLRFCLPARVGLSRVQTVLLIERHEWYILIWRRLNFYADKYNT